MFFMSEAHSRYEEPSYDLMIQHLSVSGELQGHFFMPFVILQVSLFIDFIMRENYNLSIDTSRNLHCYLNQKYEIRRIRFKIWHFSFIFINF
mgnify:CR=1 FL=1